MLDTDTLGELFMLLACSFAMVISFSRWLKHRRDIQLAQIIASAGMASIFVLLLFNFEPLQSNSIVRSEFLRPFAGSYIISSTLELGNGWLRNLIKNAGAAWTNGNHS